MFIELHILQSFVPSNLNRDDTGSPKDCEFGGARRARISSQCLKRAIRKNPAFAAATGVPLADRTKRVVGLLKTRLAAAGKPAEEAEPVATAFTEAFYSKMDAKTLTADKETQTAVLLYVSHGELDDIAAALLAQWDSLSALQGKALASAVDPIARSLAKTHSEVTSAPDIALFGRMLAEKPELGLDAACQVAHAFSTHRVAMEMDFYTAVDDLLERDEPGAGMIGVSGYNSACYYRYARVDWEQLAKNLGGDVDLALRTLEGFVQASIDAVPSGKQNSSAAYNPPSLALLVARRGGMAWNLANAFEQPVKATPAGGYVAPSLLALDRYYGALRDAYGGATVAGAAWIGPLAEGVTLDHLQEFAVGDRALLSGPVRSIVGKGV